MAPAPLAKPYVRPAARFKGALLALGSGGDPHADGVKVGFGEFGSIFGHFRRIDASDVKNHGASIGVAGDDGRAGVVATFEDA
jgi:hypothetical protein